MSLQQLLVGIAEAATRLDVSKKTVYAFHRDDPTFPRIFKLSAKKSAILVEELDAWVRARHGSHQIRPSREGGAK